MYNQTMYELGSQPSIIRELFAYGLQQAKVVGQKTFSTIRWETQAFRRQRK